MSATQSRHNILNNSTTGQGIAVVTERRCQSCGGAGEDIAGAVCTACEGVGSVPDDLAVPIAQAVIGTSESRTQALDVLGAMTHQKIDAYRMRDGSVVLDDGVRLTWYQQG